MEPKISEREVWRGGVCRAPDTRCISHPPAHGTGVVVSLLSSPQPSDRYDKAAAAPGCEWLWWLAVYPCCSLFSSCNIHPVKATGETGNSGSYLSACDGGLEDNGACSVSVCLTVCDGGTNGPCSVSVCLTACDGWTNGPCSHCSVSVCLTVCESGTVGLYSCLRVTVISDRVNGCFSVASL